MQVGGAGRVEEIGLGIRVVPRGAGDDGALLSRHRPLQHLLAGGAQVAQGVGRLEVGLGGAEAPAGLVGDVLGGGAVPEALPLHRVLDPPGQHRASSGGRAHDPLQPVEQPDGLPSRDVIGIQAVDGQAQRGLRGPHLLLHRRPVHASKATQGV